MEASYYSTPRFLGNPGCAGSGSVIIHSTVDPNPKLTSNIDYAAKTMKIGRNNEKDDGNEIFDLKREHWYGYNYLGDYKTNNEAEYSGLIEGLEQVVKMNLTSIVIQGNNRRKDKF
jgi:ribonuclease HI